MTGKLQRSTIRLPLKRGIAVLLATGTAALAQTTPPDAGRTLRDLQPLPQPSSPHVTANVILPAEDAIPTNSDQRFRVRKILVEGPQALAGADIPPLTASLEGRDVSLGELRLAAARITALYRARGFVVARAFIPAQEIRDGVVRLRVLEGILDASSIVSGAAVRASVLDDIRTAQNLAGKPIRSAELDRELLLMADLPAVGRVEGVLKPGREVGTSDLFISVSPGKSHEGAITLDNHGNRYTGQTRLGGSLDLNSPAGIGDRLALRATVTDQRLLYGHLAYDVPVQGDGLRLGTALSSSRYDLGKEFAALDASGTARTAGLFALYPMLRGLNANAWLRGAVEDRELTDDVGASGVSVRKSIQAATLEAYGDLSDDLGGGAYSTWRAAATLGRLSIASPDALAIDQAGPGANGLYQKVELGATRLQALTSHTSLFASANAQWAGKNLDSSEKLSLGGVNGVRAYPQGEAVGDGGWLASIELRQELTAGLQAALFYDHGHVRHNRDAFATGSNAQTLKGYGASLALKYREFGVKATVAWRSGPAAVSAPDHRPRFWLMSSMNF